MTNRSIETNSPTWYLSKAKITFFFFNGTLSYNLRIIFLGIVSSHNVHCGTEQFEVDANLGLITVYTKECLPFAFFAACTCMSSCI